MVLAVSCSSKIRTADSGTNKRFTPASRCRPDRYAGMSCGGAEHCLALSFGATRWNRVVECYALLEWVRPPRSIRSNAADAVAEWRGLAEGLAVLDSLETASRLEGFLLVGRNARRLASALRK
jgi:predicted RNA polymerase sigma factor